MSVTDPLDATTTFTFDGAGKMASLADPLGNQTTWLYDHAGRVVEEENELEDSRTFAYTADGQFASRTDRNGRVVEYDYDLFGRRTAETWKDSQSTVRELSFTYNHQGELLSASDPADESYTYDDNGNRTARFIDADESGQISSGDTDITIYAWDHRNRLVEVSHFAHYSDYNSESPDKVVQYAYDYQNRWVRKLVDSDGDGDTDSSTIFIYDAAESLAGGPSSSPLPLGEGPGVRADQLWAGEGPGVRAGQILLQLDHPGTGDASADDLAHRYLWGPTVDQLLADEQVTSLETPGTIIWPLGDHLNSLRDLATYDTQTDTTTISNHRVFDAFGVLHSQTNSSTACLFAFTARPLDPDTLLQNNLNRWYDPPVGRWLSQDPIGYWAGDATLYRYVRNAVTTSVDPTGQVGWPAGFPYNPLPFPWPAPGPTFPSPPTLNSKLLFGGAHYVFCCPTKKNDRLKPIPNPGTRPTPPPPGAWTPNGSNQFFPGPAEVGGCATCIGVVISCPGGTAVFHFNTLDNPSTTLNGWTWPNTCKAIVCGGTDEKESNCLADGVLKSLNVQGIEVVGVSGAAGCGVNSTGDFYEVP